MVTPTSVLASFETRVARDGARPLFTWYDTDGARVELSAITFANWVDKACNAFGTLGIDDEPVVGLPLTHDHPGHWMSWVWVLATWQAGGRVICAPREQVGMVDLAVVGPRDPHPVPGAETVACSLHPWALAFDATPAGVTDGHEIVSEPDVHLSTPTPLDDLWWTSDAGDLTGHQITDLAHAADASPGRTLVTSPGLDEMLAVLLQAVTGGGSLVVIDGAVDDDRLAAIRRDEQIH